MELDPDMDELMRVCHRWMQHLNEDDGEDLVCFVYLIRQKTSCSYDDVDDLAASVVMSKLKND